MHMTQHISSRMNQRGIRKDIVDLTIDLGEQNGDRYQLTQKIIDEQILFLQRQMRTLTDARKKGGVVVVVEGDMAVTTYRLERITRKCSKNNHGVTFTQ